MIKGNIIHDYQKVDRFFSNGEDSYETAFWIYATTNGYISKKQQIEEGNPFLVDIISLKMSEIPERNEKIIKMLDKFDIVWDDYYD